MNQRDWELLDKQLGLVAVAVFLAGIAVGSVLLAHDSSKHPQIASRDVMVAYSLGDGVPPTMR